MTKTEDAFYAGRIVVLSTASGALAMEAALTGRASAAAASSIALLLALVCVVLREVLHVAAYVTRMREVWRERGHTLVAVLCYRGGEYLLSAAETRENDCECGHHRDAHEAIDGPCIVPQCACRAYEVIR